MNPRKMLVYMLVFWFAVAVFKAVEILLDADIVGW